MDSRSLGQNSLPRPGERASLCKCSPMLTERSKQERTAIAKSRTGPQENFHKFHFVSPICPLFSDF